MNFGVVMLFYGLYYGVVSRDFSETCTEMMAASIGVSELGEQLPTKLVLSYWRKMYTQFNLAILHQNGLCTQTDNSRV